jgi:hypothetical protein
MGTFDANGFMRLIDTIGQLVPPGVVTTVQGVVVDAGEIRLTLPVIASRGQEHASNGDTPCSSSSNRRCSRSR